MEGSVGYLPVLTIQDPSDVQGAMVYDCRPPLLPVSLQLSDIGPLSGRPTVVSASVAVPPWEDGLTISGVGSDVLVVPELGVAPLVDPGMDLEDELPTPDGSPSTDAVKPGEVVITEVGPAPRGGVDLELAQALLEVAVLPMMVTPIMDPVVESSVTPALYLVPPILVLSVNDQVSVLVASSLREVVGSPVLDKSPSYLVSPMGSVSEQITSLISPSLRTDDVSRPPSGMAPMDQYLPRDTSLLLGESTDFPFLPAPLTPRLIVEEMVPGSVGVPEPVAAASQSMPDLSREGPFGVHQDASGSGASPRVLDTLWGCQYRMTSYDEDTNRSEFNPAYGIHLRDPRLLEYVGVPESARLHSRSPEYWLHHMRRERTLSAALQLQHDAGLILSNLHVLGQFVTSLNRMSSEVMLVAFDREPFPTEAVQFVAPYHCVRRAAHYMAAMGLWRPPSTQGIHGPLPSSSCNACMPCADCFPDLPR